MLRSVLILLTFVLTALPGVQTASCAEGGTIRVEGPPGATVVLDGEEVGAISDSLGVLVLDGVPAGAHAVMAFLEGCESQAVTVWLASGSERLAKFRPFVRRDWDSAGSDSTVPVTWGSIALQSSRSGCSAEVLELGLSEESSPGSPWFIERVPPGQYSVRLSFHDFSKDLAVDVRADTMTQILVGFDGVAVEQRHYPFSLLDVSGFPFDEDGWVAGDGAAGYTEYDEEPKVIVQVPPVYPDGARLSELEGIVSVQIEIDERGDVVRARVVQSIEMLDQAAVDAVMQWKFRPAIVRGRPATTRIVVPIRFTLTG